MLPLKCANSGSTFISKNAKYVTGCAAQKPRPSSTTRAMRQERSRRSCSLLWAEARQPAPMESALDLVVVDDFDQLKTLGRDRVAGKIVLFNQKFDKQKGECRLGVLPPTAKRWLP